MPLQQMTFENIVAKGENAHNEQLLLLPQCFNIHSIIALSFIESFHILYLAKGLKKILFNAQHHKASTN